MKPDICIYSNPGKYKKAIPLMVKLVSGLQYGTHMFSIISMDESGTTHNTSLTKVGTDLIVEFVDVPYTVRLSVNGKTYFISKYELYSSNLLSLLNKLLDV